MDCCNHWRFQNGSGSILPWIFVVGLPRTKTNHDAIWIVIDRLTKSAHFLPINEKFFFGKVNSAVFEGDSRTTRSSSINCIRQRP